MARITNGEIMRKLGHIEGLQEQILANQGKHEKQIKSNTRAINRIYGGLALLGASVPVAVSAAKSFLFSGNGGT